MGGSGEGDPGTGGLFVPQVSGVSPWLTVAQVLVEYAEQGYATLIVDDGSTETGQILYHVAHMVGVRNPEDLRLGKNEIPLRVTSDLETVWKISEGVNVGDFQYVGGFSVVYHPQMSEPDEHACDMGDASGVLLVMTYQNTDFRLLRTRDSDIELGSSGRLVNKA